MRVTLLAIVLASMPLPVAVAMIDSSKLASAFSAPTRERMLQGRASYYGNHFIGRETASGERYDATAMTAAHRTLPLGARVRVVEPSSQRSVVVRINDRGPFVRGRDIDLSRRAARMLGIMDEGVADVIIEVVSVPDERPRGLYSRSAGRSIGR